ncbi:unnamed protein product, partial [Phaeothamnion confervicola]
MSPAPYLCLTNRHLAPEVFAAGGEDGRIVAWDIRRATPLHVLTAPELPPDDAASLPSVATGVTGIAFQPQTPNFMFSSTASGLLYIWNTE